MSDVNSSSQNNVKELISLLKSFSKEEIGLINKAFDFSKRAHEGHLRLSGEPFFNHVFETAKTLADLGMDAKTVAAGLLHDVIEDTGVSAGDLKAEFGEEILCLVEGVTKLGALKYRGVKRHVESLRKLLVATARDVRVLIIKFADRLHNMRTLEYVPASKRRRIAEETLEIYAPLAYRLGMRALNRELEDLAFTYVYPKEHKQTKELLRRKSEEVAEHLEKIIRTLIASFAAQGLRKVRTEFRVKGLYSLWRKLERKGMDIDKIYDISALRVIVSTVSDCYKALGVIHGMWRPLPGRIKDYIAFPRPNGYRSIHTTIFTGNGGIVEIQIRTEEMHREAEYGVASHLAYKNGGDRGAFIANVGWIANLLSYKHWFGAKNVSGPDSETQEEPDAAYIPNWLKDLAESGAEVKDPKEFLEHLKADFFQHRVFAFTPKGDVVDLPIGASPVDFAYAIHSKIGDHMGGAKVNGKLVALDTVLHNGDIVEIVTRDSAWPSAKWLEFVKTGLAKKKIKAALDSL